MLYTIQSLVIWTSLCVTTIVYGQETSSLQRDKSNVDLCINKLYRYLSYKNGNVGLVDSLAFLFTENGRLTANFGKQPNTWTIQQFIAYVKDGYIQHWIANREELELFEKTEIFGKIGQRFSTYKIQMKTKQT